MSEIVEKAQKWAHEGHDSIGQKRNNGLHYWVHTDAVAELLKQAGESDEVQAAGHLHDLLEDVASKNPKYSEQEMFREFGPTITKLVKEVTNVFTKDNYPKLNRSNRKQREDNRLALISKDAKSLKLADIINNVDGLVDDDPNFGKLYVMEKYHLLPFLKNGNSTLYKQAAETIKNEIKKLQY